MAGAPSQLDLFDYKPELAQVEGKPLPPSVIGGQRYAFIRPDAAVLGPRFKFARHGQCGAELSEMLPHLAKIVDDICIVKSVHTDQFNHAPAQIFFNTGFSQPGRPSLGSWVTYGLGSESSDLPAFVVMSTGSGHQRRRGQLVERLPADASTPACASATRATRSSTSPARPASTPHCSATSLDLVGSLNRRRLDAVGDPEIATRIASYEMAYPHADLGPRADGPAERERRRRSTLYGADPDKPSFARTCLLARRLVERGVRFVNIYHEGWDAHSRRRRQPHERTAAPPIRQLGRAGQGPASSAGCSTTRW